MAGTVATSTSADGPVGGVGAGGGATAPDRTRRRRHTTGAPGRSRWAADTPDGFV